MIIYQSVLHLRAHDILPVIIFISPNVCIYVLYGNKCVSIESEFNEIVLLTTIIILDIYLFPCEIEEMILVTTIVN